MNEQTAPKRRGRPPTGTAMTPAERMARTRQKASAALANEDPAPIDQIPDTALLEALRVSYRQAMTHDMAACVAELFRRANPRAHAGQSLRVTFAALEAAEDRITATVAEIDSATVAEITSRGYPDHI